MHVHRLLLCFAVAACSADTGEPVRITGAYQRPALDTLLAPARQSERGPDLAEEVRASIQALAGTDVHRAVWATVDAMGKAGLEELYGFESFGEQGAPMAGGFSMRGARDCVAIAGGCGDRSSLGAHDARAREIVAR